MVGCTNCRYRFNREKINGFHEISLIDIRNKNKLVSFVRFSEEADKLVIEFIFSHEERQGHASRLIRAVKVIARALGKPIQAESLTKSAGFFKKQGFKYQRREAGLLVYIWDYDGKPQYM